ncbi:hypothetical protein L543_3813 [Bordetella hinzii L60]|nr:hypothetical protein L543_3813 [Bordetella hinzii L60]
MGKRQPAAQRNVARVFQGSNTLQRQAVARHARAAPQSHCGVRASGAHGERIGTQAAAVRGELLEPFDRQLAVGQFATLHLDIPRLDAGLLPLRIERTRLEDVGRHRETAIDPHRGQLQLVDAQRRALAAVERTRLQLCLPGGHLDFISDGKHAIALDRLALQRQVARIGGRLADIQGLRLHGKILVGLEAAGLDIDFALLGLQLDVAGRRQVYVFHVQPARIGVERDTAVGQDIRNPHIVPQLGVEGLAQGFRAPVLHAIQALHDMQGHILAIDGRQQIDLLCHQGDIGLRRAQSGAANIDARAARIQAQLAVRVAPQFARPERQVARVDKPAAVADDAVAADHEQIGPVACDLHQAIQAHRRVADIVQHDGACRAASQGRIALDAADQFAGGIRPRIIDDHAQGLEFREAVVRRAVRIRFDDIDLRRRANVADTASIDRHDLRIDRH